MDGKSPITQQAHRQIGILSPFSSERFLWCFIEAYPQNNSFIFEKLWIARRQQFLDFPYLSNSTSPRTIISEISIELPDFPIFIGEFDDEKYFEEDHEWIDFEEKSCQESTKEKRRMLWSPTEKVYKTTKVYKVYRFSENKDHKMYSDGKLLFLSDLLIKTLVSAEVS